jgi:cytochrome P450
MLGSITPHSNTSLDFSREHFQSNPFPVFAKMRTMGSVVPITSSFDTTVWMITTMDDAIKVLKDWQHFTVNPRTIVVDNPELALAMKQMVTGGFFGGPSMLDFDEPDHGRLRMLVSRVFTPRYIEGLRPRVQMLADTLLDRVEPLRRMDVVADYAYPLPINVICDILGVPPEEREQINNPEYQQMLVRERRANPQDDLISQLVQIEEAGDQLSEAELRGMVGILIFAGHETTSSMIGSGTLALLDNPDQMARMKAEPEVIPAAVEELLRYCAPVINPAPRFAREDIEIAGQMIRKGDVVLVALASANHDESHFSDPEELDIARQMNRHIAFGQGIHYCLGAPLARLEGEVAFATLLRRMPNLRLAIPRDQISWRGGTSLALLAYPPENLRGVTSLPVEFPVAEMQDSGKPETTL